MKSLKSMTKKGRKEVLIIVAAEMQDLCEFEPSIKTDGKSEKEIIVILTEAYGELTPEDKLSEKAIATFEFLGLRKLEVVEEEEESDIEDAVEVEEEEASEEESDSLIEQVEVLKKIKDLKDFVKNNADDFGSLADQLSGYTSVKSLKSYMIKILAGEVEAPAEKKAKEKKAKVPAAPKGKGVIATIANLIEKSGKKGISKEKIHEGLVKAFPDRDHTSMKNTINTQVPNRISKEKFKLGVTSKGNYFKDEK